MQLQKAIYDNLCFLTAEVEGQVASLEEFLQTGASAVAQRILERGGYARNLKMRIQDSCLSSIMRCNGGDTEVLSLRAIESIASDLERIAELCRDCVQQAEHLHDPRFLRNTRYVPMLERITRGIDMIDTAVQQSDTRLALRIGRAKQKLDQSYRKLHQRCTERLKQGKHIEDLVTALFVAHCLEQMGDALLNVSEAIISANLGQPVSTDRYHSMKDSAQRLGAGDDLSIEPIAETRSGSAISGISRADADDDGYVAIYKDGIKRKLKEERQGVESWHEIYPGLAPRILSYQKRGKSASLLIEHLAGLTFEQILLHESEALLDEALQALNGTLKSIWRETRTDKVVDARFMKQLADRLDQVYAIHPEFQLGASRIGKLGLLSFQQLLKRAQAREAKMKAPFSVYIHGDFNVDNIIYDPLEKHINFIDLHRSRHMDYIQDVSVFMVSIYRLQILDMPRRRRILRQNQVFYRFARKYAQKTGDASFDTRLALGLARSFITSTRFILDKSLARAMFLRGRYLIERVVEIDSKQADRFRLPIKELFIA